MVSIPKRKIFFRFSFFSIFFLLFFTFCQSSVHADMGKGPAQKFARGLAYIVASPFQLPKEIIQTAGEADPVWLAPWKGFAQGAGAGLYQMGRQGIAGFWDVLTFWTPAGREWGPLFEPSSLFPQV